MPELVGRLSQRLAAYKVPEAIMVIDKMPRNALSKVDRQMLLAMAMQAERDQRSPAAAPRLLPVTRADAKPPRRSVASR